MNVSATEYDSIFLTPEFKTGYTAPMSSAGGNNFGVRIPYTTSKYHFSVGSGSQQKINFTASNLKPYLNPGSEAPKIIKAYTAKRTMSIACVGRDGCMCHTAIYSGDGRDRHNVNHGK